MATDFHKGAAGHVPTLEQTMKHSRSVQTRLSGSRLALATLLAAATLSAALSARAEDLFAFDDPSLRRAINQA